MRDTVDADLRVKAQFSGGPRAVRTARRMVERFAQVLEPDLLHETRLLVSELVTNCVRHGRAGDADQIVLRAQVRSGVLSVEVADRGPGFAPRPPERDLEDPSGWGLFLVDRLADRWGVATGEETRVWFERSLLLCGGQRGEVRVAA
jgi:anti-sigma regulatory factor (Ser/Thr protein kinase)